MKISARASLLLILGTFAIGSVYRALHFYVTGFFVPDEYAYTFYHLGDFAYQGRYFFNLANFALFRLFGVDSSDRLVVFMPFYFMLWMGVGTISAYKAMKLFGLSDRTISATFALSLSVPVFLLFSVAVLTESVAFAMAMLGIYLTAKYLRGEAWYLPFLAALCFVAADFTRFDFIVFQVLGVVPFLRGALWKALRNFGTYALPAAFFLIIPNDLAVGTIQGLIDVANATHRLPSTSNITQITTTAASSIPPTGNIGFNVAHFLIVGFGVGFNPVVSLLIIAGLAFALVGLIRGTRLSGTFFWLGLVALGAVAGIVLEYSVVPNLPSSTAIRYSYDALPAFFVLVPLVLDRFNRRAWLAITALLLITGAAGASIYQPSLQTNLGFSYPFLNGHQSFVGLDYRTPMASIRDFLQTLPPGRFVILGEDPGSLDGNLTNLWNYTPGTSPLNVTWEPYAFAGHADFIYIPPDLNRSAFQIPAHPAGSVADWLWAAP